MKQFCLTFIIFLAISLNSIKASEYYPLIIGIDSLENTIMKGTCDEFPLNYFIETLEQSSNELSKYFPLEKIKYLQFRKTSDDKFFESGNVKKLIEKDCLKNPKKLKKYLTNLWFVVESKRTDLINDGVFENSDNIREFLAPLHTLIGILCVATEMNCEQVTWITKKY